MLEPTTDNTNHSSSLDQGINPLIEECRLLVDNIRNTDGVHYAGDPDLALRAEFLNGGLEGNHLVEKSDNPVPSEFILSGIFEIDRVNFWLTATGNYSLGN